MWGVALLHTLQNLGVFGLYDATVRGDVVERHADLCLGSVQFCRDAFCRAACTEKIHNPIEGNTCSCNFRRTATIDNASGYRNILPL
jgi:hypothetical protein